ncbi:MAG TPA: DNA (cytosine-5-)-methyltransferase [Cellvibrio sp.]|nr:DNA (cytosine-5-)-methyltransferase [Cellvibrio sp.]
MISPQDDLSFLNTLLEIYDQKFIADTLNSLGEDKWSRESINRWCNGKAKCKFSSRELNHLRTLFPSRPKQDNYEFTFIDLFAGIGGLRKGFDNIGGKCVFTSEWNPYAVKTYKANHYCDPAEHIFNSDIRDVTLSNDESIDIEQAYEHIRKKIPDHDVLLAGFPCQPFSLAGVSKKNALGRTHGFECETQGTLFFDVARIIAAKKPAAFLLENVKNLKSHDKGKTFKVITDTLDDLGYWVADVEIMKPNDPKIIDAKNFVPQHRERIVLVGFRKDLNVHEGFTLKGVEKFYPKIKPLFKDILDKKVDKKYILTPKLWEYLYNYSKKHKEKGNGFGYGLVNPKDKKSCARTLSARYHKDGSEILVDRGWDLELGEANFDDATNQSKRPRRLTPRECARLMGFDKPDENEFRIPVSDTQAYKQFGNSVVVPVFEAVAQLMKSRILAAKNKLRKTKATIKKASAIAA